MKLSKGKMVSLSTFEVLRQYFQRSDVKYSAINPLCLLRNLTNIWRILQKFLKLLIYLMVLITPVVAKPNSF